MKTKINWNNIEHILSGNSSLDIENFLGDFDGEQKAKRFLHYYGFSNDDPIELAELFGIYQEAMQFIKRFFLKPDAEHGLDLSIPNIFYSLTDVTQLIMLPSLKDKSSEEKIWASIILKVMHTILHTDKDLRYHYYGTIQNQIFDKFYKYLVRDKEDQLYLEAGDEKIPLADFQTKANKSRESTIIKLLHKKENVAEELFDRIGLRFITKNKVDVLKVIQFFKDHSIVIFNNLKPSRTLNTLFDWDKLKEQNPQDLSDNELESLFKYFSGGESDNEHSSKDYKAIHLTCRQLIKYQNPFLKQFNQIRSMALDADENELTKSIAKIDTKLIAQSIRFYYPYEIQVTDEVSHEENTLGEASHEEYKKSQLISARDRLFKHLIDSQ